MISPFPLSMFGPRRGARTRQRVFNLLVRRSDGTSATVSLDAMARALHLCKMTVWRSTLWLRAHGLIRSQRGYSKPTRTIFLVPVAPPKRRRPTTELGHFKWAMQRAVKLGLASPLEAQKLIAGKALSIARRVER